MLRSILIVMSFLFCMLVSYQQGSGILVNKTFAQEEMMEESEEGSSEEASNEEPEDAEEEEFEEEAEESLEPMAESSKDESQDTEATAEAEPESLAPPETATFTKTTDQDSPDYSYESRLHDIYINFHSVKTSESEWSALVGQRNVENYTIQSGDQLWGISKTIFGDGNYWPKVWSLNKKIVNPHLISPNNSIRFILGDESDPPSFTVTENSSVESTKTKSSAIKVETSESESKQETVQGETAKSSNAEEVDIPPPLSVSRPVIRNFPPSLPTWQDVAQAEGTEYDDTGIAYGERKISKVLDQIPMTGYIAERSPDSIGEVKEIETGNRLASAYQYVYVALKPDVGQIGDVFLAIANRGELQTTNQTISGFLGYSIEIQGEVQLVEKVNSELKDGSEMFRALVLKLVNPLGVGSLLVEGKVESILVSDEGERNQIVAQIIGGSFFNRRQVYGVESFAFINRGSNEGVAVNQILPIRANRKSRNAESQITSNIRPVGWMRIVRVTPHFATGVIVKAWSDILTGDITGSGEILPVGTVEQAKSGGSDEENDSEESDESDVTDEFDDE